MRAGRRLFTPGPVEIPVRILRVLGSPGPRHRPDGFRGTLKRVGEKLRWRHGTEGEVFLHALVPPARVLVIGATHIGQILAQLVKLTGHEVIVIDPRTAFAAEARFPNIRLDTEWPQDSIPKIGLDPYSAVVALAHVGAEAP